MLLYILPPNAERRRYYGWYGIQHRRDGSKPSNAALFRWNHSLPSNSLNNLSCLTFDSNRPAAQSFVAVREIQVTHGSEAAVFVLIILFLFYRHHSGTVMSENLGVPMGVLGFALLWRGTAQEKSVLFWLGLFVTALALNARAGAFFILPILILWSGWVFREAGRRFSLQVLIISAAVVVAAFARDCSRSTRS